MEDVTRGALVAELARIVGTAHEARFIVDEALDLGVALGHPSPPAGPLDLHAVAAARRMASWRAAGEPLQYVFGHWPFRRLDLFVDRRVLIPRPETEQVVEVALAEARRLTASGRAGRLTVVDAGTGSGAIALSVANEVTAATLGSVWATDASAEALAVAATNLKVLSRRGDVAPGAVELVEGNWLDPLPSALYGQVDLVISNPPYVSEAEWKDLHPEVRAEPRRALVARAGSDGTPGLGDVEAVLRQARTWLRSPGAVVVELAPHQARAASRLADSLGYDDVQVHPDLARRPRALLARRSADRAARMGKKGGWRTRHSTGTTAERGTSRTPTKSPARAS